MKIIEVELLTRLLKGKKVSQGYDENYKTTCVFNCINTLRNNHGLKINKINYNGKKGYILADIESKEAKELYYKISKDSTMKRVLSDLIDGKVVVPIYNNPFNSDKVRQIIYTIKNRYSIKINKVKVMTKNSYYFEYYLNKETINYLKSIIAI